MSIYSAQQLASMGRGNDSMLVHMTPREVGGLQALAMAQGGSLSINPRTGLPEAGFLDRLLPTIIGAGLTFFSGGTINPMMAAAIVGGGETIRTGDLGKGFMAGLGAFGGAGLGGSLANVGASTAEAAASTLGTQAATGPGSQAAMLAAQNEGFGQAGLEALKSSATNAFPGGYAQLPTGFNSLESAATGLKNLGSEAGRDAFMKNIGGNMGLAKYGASAAAPFIFAPPEPAKFPEQEKYEAKPPALPMPRLYNPIQKDPRKISSEYNYFEPSNPYPGFTRG